MRRKWRVWRPAFEVAALILLVLFVFYLTGDHAPRPVKGRTYTVCDLSEHRVNPGEHIRISGLVAGDPWGYPTIYQPTCADRWLRFSWAHDAKRSDAARALMAAIDEARTTGVQEWRGSFYVVAEGRLTARKGWGDLGRFEAVSVTSWQYSGDGTGKGWQRPYTPPPKPGWRVFLERCDPPRGKRPRC